MYAQLPSQLEHFFWDYDPADLDIAEHSQLIISRILEKGNFAALRALLGIYDSKQIELALLHSPNITPATQQLWKSLL